MALVLSDKPVLVLLPDGSVEIYDANGTLTAGEVLREHPGCSLGLVPDWRKSRLSPNSRLKGGMTYHLARQPHARVGMSPAKTRISLDVVENSVHPNNVPHCHGHANATPTSLPTMNKGPPPPSPRKRSSLESRVFVKHLSPVTPLTALASSCGDSDDLEELLNLPTAGIAPTRPWTGAFSRGSNPSTPRGKQTCVVPGQEQLSPPGVLLEGSGPWDVLSVPPQSTMPSSFGRAPGEGRPRSSSGHGPSSIRRFLRTSSADRPGLNGVGDAILEHLEAGRRAQEPPRPASGALWGRGGLRSFVRGMSAERVNLDRSADQILPCIISSGNEGPQSQGLNDPRVQVMIGPKMASGGTLHGQELPLTPRPRRPTFMERPGFGRDRGDFKQCVGPKQERMMLLNLPPLAPDDVAEDVANAQADVADVADVAGFQSPAARSGGFKGHAARVCADIMAGPGASGDVPGGAANHAGLIPSPTKVPSLVADRVRPLARANSANPGMLRRQVKQINQKTAADPLVLAAFKSADISKGAHPPRPGPRIARTISADHSSTLKQMHAHAEHHSAYVDKTAAGSRWQPGTRGRSIAKSCSDTRIQLADSAERDMGLLWRNLGSQVEMEQNHGDSSRLTPAPPLPRRQGNAPARKVPQTPLAPQRQLGPQGKSLPQVQVAERGPRGLARAMSDKSPAPRSLDAPTPPPKDIWQSNRLPRAASAAPESHRPVPVPLRHTMSTPPLAASALTGMQPRTLLRERRLFARASSEKSSALNATHVKGFTKVQDRSPGPSRSAAAANLERMREGLSLLLPGTQAAGRARHIAKSQSVQFDSLPPKSPKSPVFRRLDKSSTLSVDSCARHAVTLSPRQTPTSSAGSARVSRKWGGSPSSRAEKAGSLKLSNPFKLSVALEMTRAGQAQKNPWEGKPSSGGNMWMLSDPCLPSARISGAQQFSPGSTRHTAASSHVAPPSPGANGRGFSPDSRSLFEPLVDKSFAGCLRG